MNAETPEVPEHCRDLLPVLRAAVAERPPEVAPACWESVFAQAIRQDVADYLYPIVRLWPQDVRPPETLLVRWRTLFLGTVAATARRTEQAREILAALTAAGVAVVPLKGIRLAEQVYADPAQRPMCDIDLLVMPADLPRARRIVEGLGYTIDESHPDDYALTMRAPRHPLTVELHWTLGAKQVPEVPFPDLSGLPGRLAEGRVAGVRVPVLADEEQLALLAHHAMHHAFAMPMRALLDLALLLRRAGGDLDADRLAAVAEAWKLTRAAPLLAGAVAEIFDVSMPPAIAAQMPPLENENRRQVVQTLLAASAEEIELGESTLLEFGRRGWRGRIALVLRRLFVPPACLRRDYPYARRTITLPIAYAQHVRDVIRRRRAAIRGIVRGDAAVMERLDRAAERRRLAAWLLDGGPDGRR